MLVPGISWHSGRILIRDPILDSDAKFDQFMIDLRKEIGNAVENVMTATPDFMGESLCHVFVYIHGNQMQSWECRLRHFGVERRERQSLKL